MKILSTIAMTWLVWSFAVPAHAFFGFGQKKPEPPVHYVVELSLRGGYPDRDAGFSLFSEKKSYAKWLKRLKRIQNDKRVKAVIFRFGGLGVGFAKAEDMRKAIAELTKSGKKTYALLEASATPDYLAALGCQHIYMVPGGMLYMPGLRAEQLYFKDLLARVGMIADFVTVGDFKTAPEPFMKSQMSEAQRKQLNRLLGDLYNYMVERIAKGRKLEEAKVRAAIDQGLMLPSSAKQAGLIDGESYLDGLHTQLQKIIPLRPLNFVNNYGKVQRKQPTSIWSLFSWFMRRPPSKLDPDKPKIAVVYASGTINYGSSPSGFPSDDDGIWSNELIATLNKVQKLKNLRAVVLRVNSPGGSALASDLIWRKLELIKKRVPLFVSMGNVAASGGYYIAMGADVFVAQPTTITGSIGVFGGKLVLKQTLDKLGINVQTVSRGKHSGIFSTFSTFSETERSTLKTLLDQVYTLFTTKAATGRKMKHADLLKLAGGQVWTGRQALQNKLVDRLGSLEDTIALAIKRTGLKVKPQIVNYPRPKSFFEALQKMSSTAPTKPLPYALLQMFQQLAKVSPHSLKQILPIFSSPTPVLMWAPIPKLVLR